MRIAYLIDINIAIESGVQKKLKAQVAIWKELGHQVKFFSIPSELDPATSLTDNDDVLFFDTKFSRTRFKGLNVYIRKISSVRPILRQLKFYEPDIVYVREMVWFPGLNRILSQFNIVWESNTLLLDELKAIANPFVYRANRLMLPFVFKHLDGLVGVTAEITKTFEKFRIPLTISIANGVDLKKASTSSLLPPQNNRPQLILVGSPGMNWHGIEHFFKMAILTPQADFHLVGPSLDATTSQFNFFQYGVVNSGALNELYNKIDIAVGSLGLYRKNMQEACTLKVREYYRYGLPIILAHKDTDLSGTDFVLELDNTAHGVENGIEKIHAFINKWKGKRVDIQKYAHLVDARLKESMRLDFMKRVLENKNSSRKNA